MGQNGKEQHSMAHQQDQDTLDEWEQLDDDEDGVHGEPPEQPRRGILKRTPSSKKKIDLKFTKTAKEIFKMFTLSTTNQILRGVSPTMEGSYSPRFPSAQQKEKILQKEMAGA